MAAVSSSVLPIETTPSPVKWQEVVFFKRGNQICLQTNRPVVSTSAAGSEGDAISTNLFSNISSSTAPEELLTTEHDATKMHHAALGYERSKDPLLIQDQDTDVSDQSDPPSSKNEYSIIHNKKLAEQVTGSPCTAQLRKKVKQLHSQNWKLKKKVKELNEKLKEKKETSAEKLLTVNEITASAASHLTPLQLSLFKAQMMKNKKKEQGHRWSVNDKLFALQFLYVSAKAYRFLNQHLCLPSEETLKKFAAGDDRDNKLE